MAWTPQSAASTDWDVKRSTVSETVWDGGDTIWDNGGILWDASFTLWTGQGSASNTWSEQ